MAITGTKLFASGEILTATNVNQYLMRGVKVFADAAARDAAYGGAGEPTLEEGETCFLADANALQVYSGSAWLPFRQAGAGQVLQVVSTTKTDTFSTTSTSFVDITGLTVAITPSATSSKILLLATFNYSATDPPTPYGFSFKFNGGNSSAFVGDTASNRTRAVFGNYMQDVWRPFQQSQIAHMSYLDSPATTSATTYAVQTKTTAQTVFINRSATDSDAATHVRGAASITAIEVSG
jgi:hypothetical protein